MSNLRYAYKDVLRELGENISEIQKVDLIEDLTINLLHVKKEQSQMRL
ncbi:MAG: hypothetical protein ACRDCW_03835 [Sarcina sp.]